MWTRRVLLATIVAACAMSLPRHVPNAFGFGASTSDASVVSLR
jgi:hypothetical protein